MVKTGYISFTQQALSTQDENGNIIPGTSIDTDYVECNLQVIRKEYIQLVDGQAKQASYSIYVDSDLITIDLSTVSKVKLKDNHSNYLDDHQIMNVEYLDLSKRVKIVV